MLEDTTHQEHYEIAYPSAHNRPHPWVLKSLDNFCNLMPFNGIFFLSLKSVVWAASDDSYKENGQTRIRLHIVDCPVFIIVCEVADWETVCKNYYHLNQSIKSEESHKDIETLLAFAWIIIERGKEGEKKEELEVVCKVPGPW